jgi:hypothetical protein
MVPLILTLPIVHWEFDEDSTSDVQLTICGFGGAAANRFDRHHRVMTSSSVEEGHPAARNVLTGV